MTRRAKVWLGLAGAAVLVFIAVPSAVAVYYLVNLHQGRSLFRQGYNAMNQGDHDAAIVHFTAALRKKLGAHRAYAYQDRGYCHQQKGRGDEAISDYDQALRMDPKLIFAYVERAGLFHERREDDKSLADYSEAIRLDPNHVGAFHHRGLILMQSKKWDEAIADFSEEIRASSEANPEAYLQRGMCYQGKNNLDGAIASFDSAIRAWPNFARAYFQRGFAYGRKMEMNKAKADFSEAIRLDPRYEAAYVARAIALGRRGQWMEAMNDFQTALKLNPKNARALEGLAQVHVEMGEPDRAIGILTEMIQNGKPATAYRGRAAAYTRKGEYRLALADFREAARVAPNETGPVNNLGWFLATCPNASLRDGKQAVINATKACELSNWKDGTVLDTLAAAYAETGDFDRAVSSQKQALGCENVTKERRAELEKRLALYQNHKPYREERKKERAVALSP